MNDQFNDFGVEITSDFDDFFNPFDDSEPDDSAQTESAEASADNPADLPEGGDFGRADIVTEEDVEQTKTPKRVDTRTTEEKLADLMKAMQPQRKTVLGILRMCKDRVPVTAVNRYVEELQQYNYSVFSAAAICTMLEQAGGLIRVVEDGTPFDEVEVEPVLGVDEDGVECLVPGEPPEMFWEATPEGIALCEAENPAARLAARLAKDETLLPAYKRTLQMAATDTGATRDALYDALEPTLVTLKPRVYSPLFVERLSKCDAIEWRGAWFITDLGRQCLESLADVPDIL
ncbi:MAG: hypothetical protein IKD70_08905 [Eggerthellaceae bacterium]|nr:hypothetical protein [Eggerthellaceae bacterium]